MGGPESGKYLLQPFGIQFPPFGVKKSGEILELIIPGGSENVFTITKDDNVYYIRVTHRATAIEGENVVAMLPVESPNLIEFTPWNISGPEGGPYTISKPAEAVGAIQCWTAETPSPEPHITLKFYTPEERQPKWNFIKHE